MPGCLEMLYRYFDYFDLFLCGKRDIIDFKHWQTVVFFVQVLSPSDTNECSHYRKRSNDEFCIIPRS